MGVPEGRSIRTPILLADKWFGKAGKIVTVVEKIKEEVDDGKGGRKTRVVKDEERQMRGI